MRVFKSNLAWKMGQYISDRLVRLYLGPKGFAQVLSTVADNVLDTICHTALKLSFEKRNALMSVGIE